MSGKRRKLLVVDFDACFRQRWEDVVHARMSYSWWRAYTEDEAKANIRHVPFDLVIAPVRFRGGDILDVLRFFRGNGSRAKFLIVNLSNLNVSFEPRDQPYEIVRAPLSFAQVEQRLDSGAADAAEAGGTVVTGTFKAQRPRFGVVQSNATIVPFPGKLTPGS